MNNSDIASALDQVGTLIELREDNPFRARAYHNAARAVQNLSAPVADLAASGELATVPGLGKEMRAHIAEMLDTGEMALLNELLAAIPPGLVAMIQIPGLGPKRIRALSHEIGVTTIAELAAACHDGRVAAVPGFGAKSQEKILKGIDFLAEHATSFSYAPAEAAARDVVAALGQMPGVLRTSVGAASGGAKRSCTISTPWPASPPPASAPA